MPNGRLLGPTLPPGAHFPPTGLLALGLNSTLPWMPRTSSLYQRHFLSPWPHFCSERSMLPVPSPHHVSESVWPVDHPLACPLAPVPKPPLPIGSQPLLPTNAPSLVAAAPALATASYGALPGKPWSWRLTASPHPPSLQSAGRWNWNKGTK